MKTAMVILFVLLAVIVPPTTAFGATSTYWPGDRVYDNQTGQQIYQVPSGYYGGSVPYVGNYQSGQDFRAEGTSIRLSVPVGKRGRLDVGHVIQKATSRPAAAPKPEVIVVEKPAEPVAVVETTNKPTLKLVDATTGKKICTVADWKQKDLRPGTTDIVFTRGLAPDAREIARYRVVNYSDGVAYVRAVGQPAPFKGNDNIRVDYN